MANDNFWGNIGSGLLSGAAGYYTGKSAEDDAKKKLAAAQGPLFQQQQALAGQAYNTATSMDPTAMAKNRFNEWESLTDAGRVRQEQELQRKLLKQGQLGIASNAPVEGADVTPGQPVNPQLAALYAAQAGQKRQAAFDSMNEGQRYLDATLQRGGMLSRDAQAQRAGNLAVQPPSAPSLGSQILGGLGKSVMANPGMLTGLLGKAGGGGGIDMSWLYGGIGSPISPLRYEDVLGNMGTSFFSPSNFGSGVISNASSLLPF